MDEPPSHHHRLPLPGTPAPATYPPGPLIAIVGVCASGKSTLAVGLQRRGLNARQVSQEHSYVRDLWRRFSHADRLIFLDAGLETIRARLRNPGWPEWLLARQRERLEYARSQCDLYVHTDELTAAEVLARVLAALAEDKLQPF